MIRDPLPIDPVLPALLDALRHSPAVVLRAPTGAGKTTRVPPALLDGGFAQAGRVVVLEPRRLAARAAARRMAQERGGRLGDEIGYHVRFDHQFGKQTRVLVVTPGILLRQLHDDPFLESAAVIVFDEFHERSLDSDLALGLIRLVQQTVRPELRIVVMSATLATEAVAKYLGDCPIVTSEGRLHPVEIVYEPRSVQQPWPEAAAAATERLLDRTDGDVLVFLPGMQEIRQTARLLDGRDLLVLPLHGDLPPAEQDRALLPQPQRKVVLATNVAETSVTVEGVTGVVDTGLARMLVLEPNLGLDRLELTPIARDSADQRAGRAGRQRPGVCVRLWSEASHRLRPAQTEPEIRRVDLAGAVLHLLSLGESDLDRFPWLEPPKPAAVAHALELLARLGAIEGRSVTALGQQLARLPVHPRLGRLLVEGERWGAADRAALAAALLSERDPFLRPAEGTPRKAGRAASSSDVLDRVEALEEFERRGAQPALHEAGARSVLRVRDQLLRTLQGERRGSSPPTDRVPSDEAILRALLAAFPDRVARRRDNDPTRGLMVGGRGVRLAPSSRVTESALFVCIDVDGRSEEAWVRQASAIEREWLAPTSAVEVYFDPKTERVSARRRVRYDDLVLEESPAALPAPEETARVLAEAARDNLPRVLPPDDSAGGSFLLRVYCLRDWMPELGLPAFSDDELRELLPWACAGCRSFEDVRRADWLGLLQGKLSRQQLLAVEREAPERIEVPSGSRIALTYEIGRPPVLAVRIQELFGMSDTPRIAGGRVRVLLHLLGPNYRPQQVTEDLASFWENTYPQVRKDLRARYPKHAWPEEPRGAPPQRRPGKR